MDELTGLLLLLSLGAIATVLVLSVVIAHDAIHPPRHTAGYAVAHGRHRPGRRHHGRCNLRPLR